MPTSKLLKNIFSIHKSKDHRHLVATVVGYDIPLQSFKSAKPPSLHDDQLRGHKISIIMPVYNTDMYLCETMESLVNQTYRDIEIICVNDASTDASLSILRRYEKIDARVKVIDPGKVYQATARNIGIRAATGEFIMFCDSDDKYSPGMCRRMLEVIIQENVDLVACDCNVIVENGHNRPREDIEYKYLKIFGHWRIKDAISRNIESINVLLWNKIYKKSTIDRYGIILPDGCEYDDDAFLFQYLSVSDSFYGLDESLYIYRARENSVMDKVHKHKIEKTIYDMFKIQKHKADFVARNKLKDKVWKYFTALLNNDVRRAYDFILLSPEEKLKGLEVLNETLEYINTRLQCNFKISIGNIEVNEYRHD